MLVMSLELNGRILKNFDNYLGAFAGSQEWPAERKELSYGNVPKLFYILITRFAAHLIIKIPPMEWLMATSGAYSSLALYTMCIDTY